MRAVFRFVAAAVASGAVLTGPGSHLSGQELPKGPATISAEELPNSPTPQVEVAAAELPRLQTARGQDRNTAPPAANAGDEKVQQDKADEQIDQQVHQRVMGIIPNFNTSYVGNAVSLTPAQKFRLAFRSSVDPYAFGVAFLVAGFDEAKGDTSGFGWGAAGYGKHAGAAYLDAFDGTMIGNAVFPALLRQDPRYFRLGHGAVTRRLLYAVSRSFICKHDHTGKWEPNYSNIGGNLASGAISNLYYPGTKSALDQTFRAGLTVTLTGTFGATLQEFWPDIARKVFHKDPTNGQDAQARAADREKK